MIWDRSRLAKTPAHDVALDCIEAGIEVARPARAMRGALERIEAELRIDGSTSNLDQYADIVVIGGGKAAAQMARVLEEVLGDRLTKGVVVTNDPVETDRITVVEGSHPTPDEAGRDGAQRVLSVACSATEDTLVLCSLSGGGSALLPAPTEGVSLEELRSLTDNLLSNGATIDEIKPFASTSRRSRAAVSPPLPGRRRW
jgi:hydroxypyruvate reductase